MNRKTIEYFRGCLLGGAVGDALGAPVEFMSIDQIRQAYGAQGLTDYDQAYGRTGAITDDTQMTLFTAEGVILSQVRQEYRGDEGMVLSVYNALLRWLATQEAGIQEGLVRQHGTCAVVDGVLAGCQELYSRRAPGNACLSSLGSGIMGRPDRPVNDSKGCGGVMRMAPVGLAFDDARKAFEMGCRCAAVTHGHPTGFLASGFLAALISRIVAGEALVQAIETVRGILKGEKESRETLVALDRAVEAAQTPGTSPEAVESLGSGWIAEEALGISVYCALAAGDDFEKGMLLAVNHSGDSDSTGAVTGNILGTLYGEGIIPGPWIERLELNGLIGETAEDLFNIRRAN